MNKTPEVLADDHQQYFKQKQAWGFGVLLFLTLLEETGTKLMANKLSNAL